MAIVPKLVGEKIKRREDPRLITGLGTYVDDLKLADLLYVTILRSMYAHARIKSINVQEAAQLPGVVAVITGDQIKDQVGQIPVAGQLPGLKVPPHYSLAVGKVCYVGEPVVAVVATDRYVARDALDLIAIDYEPLPVVTNPEKAVDPGSPVIHEQWSDNVAFTWKLASGDADKAFQEADRVVKERFINQRLAPIPMESRGVVAQYHPGLKELTLWSSTQIPHLLRTQLAIMLKIPENQVRVIAPEVGGGFGCKLNVYAEEAIVGYLAMKIGKPVKWSEERRENFLSTIHGRDQINDVEVAVKNDGTITGIRCKVIADIGAYHQLLTPIIPTLTGLIFTGSYKIQNLVFDLQGAFTNKMATDAYRGAGRPEATYIIERMVDLVAMELRLDPVDVRKKNFIPSSAFPYQIATGLLYDSGNYEASFDKALEMVDYKGLREEQKKLRGEGKYLGIGISTYVEICGMGPSAAMPAGGWESATVRVEPTGKVTVLTGASPHGQGEETTFSQIAADSLGVDFNDVLVVHGDTSVVQYGIGTFGSRATAVGGAALVMALEKVKTKMVKIAAHLLEAAPDDLLFEGGKISVKGSPDRALDFQAVVNAAYLFKTPIPGVEPGLEESGFFEPSNFTFPFGAHIAVVEIDG
ncbi:MAG: xanthine dehydrogenase family protein, partial [Candidatus Tectomicrobia bacterium]|nr:xanthine dehydrogenase family protein [Candidatus Tectomicrobia bacterium]